MSARHCAPVILRLCPSSMEWSLNPFRCHAPRRRSIQSSLRLGSPNRTRSLDHSLPRRMTGRGRMMTGGEWRFGTGSILKHRDRADRRAGALAPFQRQADELELALAEQCFEVAQALDVGEAEIEAGFVHE